MRYLLDLGKKTEDETEAHNSQNGSHTYEHHLAAKAENRNYRSDQLFGPFISWFIVPRVE